MTEVNVSPEVIKKTQDTLGKYVKKPPLSEKLLKKPPFRFLHDIINVVIADTGYLKGLYAPEELVSDNIIDRDGKIAFLQKLIDFLKEETNQKVSVKPSKIVAGLEPERTNELLQILALGIDKNKNGSPGETKNKEKIAKPPPPTKAVADKSRIEKNTKSTRATVKNNSQNVAKEAEKPKSKKSEGINKASKPLTDKNVKPSSKPSSNSKVQMQPKSRETIKPKQATSEKVSKSNSEVSKTLSTSKENVHKSKDIIEELEVSSGPEQKSVVNGGEISESNDSLPNGIVAASDSKPLDEFAAIIDEEAERRKKEKPKSSGKQKQRRMSSTENGVEELNADESVKNTSNDENNPNIENKPKPVKATPNSNSKNAVAETNDKDKSRRHSYVRQESGETKMNTSRTSLRPPSVRPASARPAAPRRRDKNIEIVLQPDETIKMGEINIKMESFIGDDDGENLIVIEDPTMPTDDLLNSNKLSAGAFNAEEEEQGHLVQKILETQKEFSNITNSDPANGLQTKAETEWDQSMTSQRQSSAKQMEGLRESIQKLTRSINPLGKLMDYLQEDIDSMQREVQMWRESYQETLIEFNKEKSLTANAIEPLKHQLVQINASIKEHKDIIDTTRANILLNEQKILKLVAEI